MDLLLAVCDEQGVRYNQGPTGSWRFTIGTKHITERETPQSPRAMLRLISRLREAGLDI
ncbi:hypothetical protein NC315_34185 [Streptomyces sp. G2]|uniref:hypothetical protein n=1 Tax=Streptomyces sp. G2 TaxID=1684471 RepID=UPI0020307162|nr:hypothetical protein [Streptomyces sp. G2]MCM1950382.1 hypothetical protein [Streptomyces sp. G2]